MMFSTGSQERFRFTADGRSIKLQSHPLMWANGF